MSSLCHPAVKCIIIKIKIILSPVHLSTDPESIFTSLRQLSDPDMFESAMDSFFDLGYKLYCLQ